jgi:hypothetical protein
MASLSLPLGGNYHGGFHCSNCLGVLQRDEKRKSMDEVQRRESGGGPLAESCFNAETSTIDRQILANLERELQAAFRFEDGNGELANSIWVARILFGRLLRERTAVGRTIKQFAKFQRREIMHGMVKLNDLEDMAKPPLHDSMEAYLRNQRLQGGNDMETEAGDDRGASSSGFFGPEGSHPGLR